MIKENITSIECLNKIESLMEMISCKCEESYETFGKLREYLDELNELDKLKKELENLRYVLKLLVYMFDLEVKCIFRDYYLEGTDIEEKLCENDAKLMKYVFDEYC